MSKFFFYERAFDGKFHPVTQNSRPESKRTDGVKRRVFTPPIELSQEEEYYRLDYLASLYPQPAKGS